MNNKEKWEQILREVVSQETKSETQPTPAASLRQKLVSHARKEGLQFPPPDEPELKFGEFLHHFPNVVATVRRPGGDLWVAPASATNLLIDAPAGQRARQSGVRTDLFDAFTDIRPERKYWYEKDSDQFVSTAIGFSPPADGSYIEVPKYDLSGAKKIRLDFMETVGVAGVKVELAVALNSKSPLGSFSSVIRRHALQPQWHEFRAKSLLAVIGDWATKVRIPWAEGWITGNAGGASAIDEAATAPADTPNREWRRALIAFVNEIDEGDMARISIPLDVLAKILVKVRK